MRKRNKENDFYNFPSHSFSLGTHDHIQLV